MANPEFIEEKPLSLVDVQKHLEDVEKRDEELNYLSNKCKEYLSNFVNLSTKEKEDLYKKLLGLKLTRLKEEYIMKIIDFLPKNVEDLKIVLQAYPLSLPKKDQEAIVGVMKEFA